MRKRLSYDEIPRVCDGHEVEFCEDHCWRAALEAEVERVWKLAASAGEYFRGQLVDGKRRNLTFERAYLTVAQPIVSQLKRRDKNAS